MAKRKTATLQSIADDHSVSIATVSRVLNNKGNVSSRLKQAITVSLLEAGYTITAKKSDSQTIVVFVPDYSNPFNVDVLAGIEKAAGLSNYHMVIIRTKSKNTDTLAYYLSLIEDINASGIISLSPFSSVEIIKKLNDIIPTVMCSDYIFDKNLSLVSIDDQKAAFTATDFLIKSGRRRLLHINSTLNHHYAVMRQEGFTQACHQHNLELDEKNFIHLSTINYSLALSQLNYTLKEHPQIDAIFASSDIFAAAAIAAANFNDHKVPEDIAVVGFDNIEIASIIKPALTTINQPRFEIGYQSFELLNEKIQKENRIEKQIFLETNLIIRDST